MVEGEPYAGYDRHNAEVAAFHLDRILGFRRAPLVVGRHINLRTEIKPVATEQLLSTFLTQGQCLFSLPPPLSGSSSVCPGGVCVCVCACLAKVQSCNTSALTHILAVETPKQPVDADNWPQSGEIGLFLLLWSDEAVVLRLFLPSLCR